MKFLVNVDVLSTGFDAPCIDAIAVLRATMSPGLFCQIVGRGSRRHESKKDALILDFGENFARHGSIDHPNFGRGTKGHGEVTGEAPTKLCPGCQAEVALAALECLDCGLKFPDRPIARHNATPDEDANPVQGDGAQVWKVESWSFWRHKKKVKPDEEPKPDTLRVDYLCTLPDAPWMHPEKISEWVCVQHSQFAGMKAERWWKTHTRAKFSGDIDVAIDLFHRGAFAMPLNITVVKEDRFHRVVERAMPELPETWVNFDELVAGDAFEGGATINEWGEKVTVPKEDDCPF